jgi:rSAM/selenodomain-associated transferase 2
MAARLGKVVAARGRCLRNAMAIVVPVRNEQANLPAAWEHLAPFIRQGVQVILVDGGSTDGTVALAQSLGFAVIQSATGRARQMNTGAEHATGDTLLFLHIDTQLPSGWLSVVQSRLHSTACWGRFDVRITGQSHMLKVVALMMNWRSRVTGIATGDQALFMTRAAFSTVGGFPDQPLMEDIEMSKRLLRLSRPACIADKVTTSGRRWESRGVWRTIFLMWRLRFAYWRGHSASELAKAYQ